MNVLAMGLMMGLMFLFFHGRKHPSSDPPKDNQRSASQDSVGPTYKTQGHHRFQGPVPTPAPPDKPPPTATEAPPAGQAD